MQRKTFDILVSAGALLLVAVLAVAGGLLTWGSSYINNQVHSQLAAQKITFPPQSAFAAAKVGTEITPSMIPSVSKYAGQQLVTGQQAEAYADHFIAVHLQEIGGGKTYAQLSTEAQAQPNNTALANQVATVFKGTTLRSMLLTAYGFSTMGRIAGDGANVAFGGAAGLLVLAGFGFYHGRKVPASAEVLAHQAHLESEKVNS